MRPNRPRNEILPAPRSRRTWTASDLSRASDSERRQRRSVHQLIALGAMVLAGLAVTTLVSEALEYRGSPFDPAPRAHSRAA